MLVSSAQSPGHAQTDSDYAPAIMGGLERKIHFLVVETLHTDARLLKVYPAEAFSDPHVIAFDFFDEVPGLDFV